MAGPQHWLMHWVNVF